MTDQAIVQDPQRQLALWFAFLSGAVAWFLHLLSAYIIAEFGCILGWDRYHLLGISVIAWALVVASVLLLGLALAATVVGWRLRQRYPQAETDQNGGRGAGPYMARAGFISSAVFALIILAQMLPILFYLRRC